MALLLSGIVLVVNRRWPYVATAVFQLEMPPLLEIQVQQESTQKKNVEEWQDEWQFDKWLIRYLFRSELNQQSQREVHKNLVEIHFFRIYEAMKLN